VNLSILLESDDGRSAGPDFKLLEQKQTLQEIIRANNFSFELNADSVGNNSGSIIPGATATQAGAAESETIQFSATSVEFTAPGYPPADDPLAMDQNQKDAIDAKGKLIVFALDNSGSLLGSDDRQDTLVVNTYNDMAASDRGDNRKVFFDQMLDLFNPRDHVSLVKISTNGGNIIDCNDSCTAGSLHLCSTPTRERSVVRCGLQALATDEAGTTPINQVLKDIYRRVILNSTDLNPVVVLFTDGAEDDDTIESLLGPDGAIELFANGYQNNALTAPVPVFVLHLDQKPIAAAAVEDGGFGFRAGRDERLMQLACATGGDYIFLEGAEEMTSGRLGSLSRIVRNRIEGAWTVTAETGLGELEAADWYVSTTMRVTVANKQLSFAMERGDVSDPSSDSRLWFSRE
jgi:Mg-chelatase subunit ChlD